MSRAKHLSTTRGAARKRPSQKSQSKPGPFLSGNRLTIVLSLSLAAATILLYSPILGYRFILWDDHDYVTANRNVQRGLAWSTVQWAFTATDAANWHPLTWLSHALDYQLFALNPLGHHLDNLLIHALNAVLLFLLLQWMTRRVWPSLLVASLFALHPLNVESVAWIAERKNVLSTLFSFLAIAAYVRYVHQPDWRRYLLLAALFAAALMAKPMVITLPFVLLLLDYWPLGRTPLSKIETGESHRDGSLQLPWSRLVVEKIPLFALSAASAWITLKAQHGAVRSFAEFPFGVRVENAIVAYALYLWKMVWPANLAALYPHPPGLLPLWQVALAAAALVGITVLVLVFRGKGYLPVGWFWFLGTLVPVIGLVQVGEAAMADRYAYLSLIGIFIMIAWSLDDWAEDRKVRTVWRLIPMLCVLIALAVVTSRQMSYWESEYAVWAHTVQVTDENPQAHARLAAALLHPDVAMTQRDLQNFDTAPKRLEAARQHYEEAVRTQRQLAQRNPDEYLFSLATFLNDLGVLDSMQNRSDDQRRHYEEALRYYRKLVEKSPDKQLPSLALGLYNLGNLDLREHRTDDARSHYEEALKIQSQLVQQSPDLYLPDVANTLINMGNLDLQQNRLDDAREHGEQALKIQSQLVRQNPDLYLSDLAMTQYNLGFLDQQQNRLADARQYYEQALNSYRQLEQRDPRKYRQDAAEITSILQDLDKNSGPSQNPASTARLP